MADEKAKKLAKQLKNIGPQLAAHLIEVGLDSPEKLRKLGAKAAYQKMYKEGDAYGDFNAAYIYALEGAIRNCNWLEIPDEIKKEAKEFVHKLQKEKKSNIYCININMLFLVLCK